MVVINVNSYLVVEFSTMKNQIIVITIGRVFVFISQTAVFFRSSSKGNLNYVSKFFLYGRC